MGHENSNIIVTRELGKSNDKTYALIVRGEGESRYRITLDVNGGESEIVLADGKDFKDTLALFNTYSKINACGYARGFNDAFDMTCQTLR